MRTYLRMHDSGLNYLRRGNGGMVAAADLAAAVELAATAEMGVVSAAAICLPPPHVCRRYGVRLYL